MPLTHFILTSQQIILQNRVHKIWILLHLCFCLTIYGCPKNTLYPFNYLHSSCLVNCLQLYSFSFCLALPTHRPRRHWWWESHTPFLLSPIQCEVMKQLQVALCYQSLDELQTFPLTLNCL